MRKHEIVSLIARHAATEGVTDTPLEGLQLFRMSHPVERLQAMAWRADRWVTQVAVR